MTTNKCLHDCFGAETNPLLTGSAEEARTPGEIGKVSARNFVQDMTQPGFKPTIYMIFYSSELWQNR